MKTKEAVKTPGNRGFPGVKNVYWKVLMYSSK